MRGFSKLTVVGLLVCLSFISRRACATAETIYFEHEDERYLYPSQHNGGAAVVPQSSHEVALPMLVFLHGTNPSRAMHFWLGGGDRDLRPVATQMLQSKRVTPFIFAAPSQTREAAHGRNLWTHFDFARFVDDVAQALEGRAQIDRERVVLVGHSGAGCNVRGGLASDVWRRPTLPQLLVAIDPCMDTEQGQALARRPEAVPLWVLWQGRAWPRTPAAFQRAIAAGSVPGRSDRVERWDVSGPAPHEAILPLALKRIIGEVFAAPRDHAGAS